MKFKSVSIARARFASGKLAGRRLAWLIAVALFAPAGGPLHADAIRVPTARTTDGEAFYTDNQSFDANSNSFLVYWAISKRDNIVQLKIPASYIEFVGDCLPFGKVDGNCKYPFAIRLTMQAMLPQLTPVPNRQLTPEEQEDVVHIYVSSIYEGAREDLNARLPLIESIIELKDRVGLSGTSAKAAPKEPRFGLARIGLPDLEILNASNKPNANGWLNEFYYPSASAGGQSTCSPFVPPKDVEALLDGVSLCREWIENPVAIGCLAEVLPNKFQIGMGGLKLIPFCNERYLDQTFGAFVTLRFQRKHLNLWDDIWPKATSLFRQFLNEGNRR